MLRSVQILRYVAALREGSFLPGLAWPRLASCGLMTTEHMWQSSQERASHGAAMIFQHDWPPVEAWAARRYDLSDHILLGLAENLDDAADAEVDAALPRA